MPSCQWHDKSWSQCPAVEAQTFKGAMALYRAISTRKGNPQSTEWESMQLWSHSLTDTTPATSNLDLGKKKREGAKNERKSINFVG